MRLALLLQVSMLLCACLMALRHPMDERPRNRVSSNKKSTADAGGLEYNSIDRNLRNMDSRRQQKIYAESASSRKELSDTVGLQYPELDQHLKKLDAKRQGKTEDETGPADAEAVQSENLGDSLKEIDARTKISSESVIPSNSIAGVHYNSIDETLAKLARNAELREARAVQAEPLMDRGNEKEEEDRNKMAQDAQTARRLREEEYVCPLDALINNPQDFNDRLSRATGHRLPESQLQRISQTVRENREMIGSRLQAAMLIASVRMEMVERAEQDLNNVAYRRRVTQVLSQVYGADRVAWIRQDAEPAALQLLGTDYEEYLRRRNVGVESERKLFFGNLQNFGMLNMIGSVSWLVMSCYFGWACTSSPMTDFCIGCSGAILCPSVLHARHTYGVMTNPHLDYFPDPSIPEPTNQEEE